MSDYRREQLLTYVAGPAFVVAGVLILYVAIIHGTLDAHKRFSGIETLVLGLVGLAHVLYGRYVIRDGRRRLASNHWRAEHFVP